MLQCKETLCRELRGLLKTARRVGDSGEARFDGLCLDSRRLAGRCAFFALPGAKADGARFVADAFAAGAPLAVAQREVPVPPGRELLVVEDVRQALADAVGHLFRDLLRRLVLVGVTGTCGKTTTTYFVRSILAAGGMPAAALGTTGFLKPDGTHRPLHNTTPDLLDLLGMFVELDRSGHRHVAMEVSSASVVQRRVAGLPFRVGVFTNLSPEHMETHGDMETYTQAKLSFFREAGPAATRLGQAFIGAVNADDAAAERFEAACPGPPFLFGSSDRADVRAAEVAPGPDGSRFFLTAPGVEQWVELALPGRHNVANALAAAAAACALGLGGDAIVSGLEALQVVPGRLQRVPGRSRCVYVDYAHTSDEVEKLLASCREMASEGGRRVVVVFGCGGDRDKTKRPRMGAAAARLADRCWLTSDNPRSEDPRAIIDDVLAGIPAEHRGKVQVEPDRRLAIVGAIKEASPEDLVVLAGKGHEDYQILGGTTIHFDDLEEASRVLEELDHGNAAGLW